MVASGRPSRCLALVAGLAVAVLMGPAQAKPPGATFEAETKGLPVATEIGHWVLGDGAATLVFAGGHAVGEETSFVARWNTEVLPGDAEWAGHGRVVAHYVGPEVRPVRLVKWFRYRDAGELWSHWFRLSTSFRSQTTMLEDFESVVRAGRNPKTVQYQWKLKGVIPSGATLTGEYELTT